MEIAQLPAAIDTSVMGDVIEASEAAFSDEELADKAATKLVVQDYQLGESFQLEKALPAQWDEADRLYSAWVDQQPWPGTEVPRAALGMPLLLETGENLNPQIMSAFFGDAKPIQLEPMPGTELAAAKAYTAILLWELKASGLKEEFRKCSKWGYLYGFTIGKWGWKRVKRKRRVFAYAEPPKSVDTGVSSTIVPTKKSGKLKWTDVEQVINQPTFDYIPLRHIKFDPGLRDQDIRNAKWVCHQYYVTADDLDQMRDDECYKNIPSREQLVKLCIPAKEKARDSATESINNWAPAQASARSEDSTKDPLSKPFEVLEYTTKDRIICVLQRQLCIRNEDNPFGVVNYVSAAFVDAPDSAVGFGASRLIGNEQKIQQGAINMGLDNFSLAVLGVYEQTEQGPMGAQNNSQVVMISPGRVLKKGLKPVLRESGFAEVLAVVQNSEARAQRRVGSNSTLFGGAAPDQPGMLRTGAGVNAMTAGADTKLQYIVENLSDMIVTPVIEAFHMMNLMYLEPEQVNAILGEETGQEYQGSILEIYNGQYKFNVLAANKLKKRRAAVNALMPMTQLLGFPSVQQSFKDQGKKLDYVEFFGEFFDGNGLDASRFIVDMNEEDKARAQADSMAAQAMAKQAQMAQQQSNAVQLSEVDNENKLGRDIAKITVKHELDQKGATDQMHRDLHFENKKPVPPKSSNA